jgi:hypothetical protein
MYIDNKKSVKLSELIHWVKQELLSAKAFENDSVPLFVIDEVIVEINFVLAGEADGGFDLQVVKAGTKVSEERVQKAIVKMKSLVPYERVRERLEEKHLKHLEDRVVKVIVKGLDSSEQAVPPRE